MQSPWKQSLVSMQWYGWFLLHTPTVMVLPGSVRHEYSTLGSASVPPHMSLNSSDVSQARLRNASRRFCFSVITNKYKQVRDTYIKLSGIKTVRTSNFEEVRTVSNQIYARQTYQHLRNVRSEIIKYQHSLVRHKQYLISILSNSLKLAFTNDSLQVRQMFAYAASDIKSSLTSRTTQSPTSVCYCYAQHQVKSDIASSSATPVIKSSRTSRTS